jgi:NADPH:quinone reductase and related Zn-dependent oxidoreductases
LRFYTLRAIIVQPFVVLFGDNEVKAAFYEKCGGASDVLQISELPDPTPGVGEVRVRIAFSGLNPTDIKSRTGFAGSKQKFPRIIPHQDGSGVIDMVGPDVKTERIGQKVWVYGTQSGRAFGTAAQYVVIPFSKMLLYYRIILPLK